MLTQLWHHGAQASTKSGLPSARALARAPSQSSEMKRTTPWLSGAAGPWAQERRRSVPHATTAALARRER